jgi:hypothetical protein
MGTTTGVLSDAVRKRHEELETQFAAVRDRFEPGGTDLDRPREAREQADGFLADVARHVHAVSAVLLPVVRKDVAEGKRVVHDYMRAVRALEVVLAHVRAHEFGSTYELHFTWVESWDELASVLVDQRDAERDLARRLDEQKPDDAEELADRLLAEEENAPTRPHPYTPHVGALGSVSRTVMRAADAFWDDAQGRMVSGPEKPPRKKPGLLGRYLMARPQIDEDS